MPWGWGSGAEPAAVGLGVSFSAEACFHSALVSEGSSPFHPNLPKLRCSGRTGWVASTKLLPIASAALAAQPPDLPGCCWHLSSCRARGLFQRRTTLLLGEENGMQANAEEPW